MLHKVLAAVPRVSSDNKGSSPIETRRSYTRWTRPNNVITAFLCAKLFGFKVLTIDARVVHAPTEDLGEVASMVAHAQAVTPPPHQTRTRRDGQRASLAYAVRLLEEGSKSLDEARGVRASIR